MMKRTRLAAACCGVLAAAALLAVPAAAQEGALGLAVSIDDTATFSGAAGTVTLTGTVSCAEEVELNMGGSLYLQVGTQPARAPVRFGFEGATVTCSPPSSTWSLTLSAFQNYPYDEFRPWQDAARLIPLQTTDALVWVQFGDDPDEVAFSSQPVTVRPGPPR